MQLTSVLRAVRGRTVPLEPAAAGQDPAAVPAPRRPRRPGADLVRARAVGAGLAEDDAVELVARVERLSDREAWQVVDPRRPARGASVLRFGTAAARQVDETSCGAAVLAMLAAHGNPAVALWLVTGEHIGETPSALDGVAPASGPAGRLAGLQAALHVRSTRRAVLGALPWPTALGTPPWGAARVATELCSGVGAVHGVGGTGIAYRSVMLDDTRHDEVRAVLARIRRALAHGVPVPLYTGGDASSGLAAAVPRHVVLVTGADATSLRVYEPSTGQEHVVAEDAVLAGGTPRAAYGGWSHVCWALLPVRRA